jgi:GntR family carbon starvation induced transcriptional regulator
LENLDAPAKSRDTSRMVTISSPVRTLAEQTYGALKGDLLAGAFAPGAALLTRDLLARYGCGISPLREALARLVGEGLLVASGHRGVRVPLPSRADLDELYRIRGLLECEALRLAMVHGDDQWEALVLGACHRLERASLPGRAAAGDRGERVIEWEARHRAFHAALIAAAPAPKLLRLIDQMVDQTERYRALRLLHSPTERLMRDIAAEHRALVDAALARNGRATELLAEHLERTRRFVAGLFKREEAAARGKKPARGR